MLAGAAFGPGQAWESFDRCGPPPRRFMLRAQAALPPRQPAARLPPAPPSGAHTACNPTRAVGPGRAGRHLGPWAGLARLLGQLGQIYPNGPEARPPVPVCLLRADVRCRAAQARRKRLRCRGPPLTESHATQSRLSGTHLCRRLRR